MIDKTTVGVTAEPEEVEAALRNLCGYHLAEPDPLFRYTVLTREQVLYGALVASIKRERGRALAELAASGQKMAQIAEMTNLTSRQQVQRLISVAKAAEEAAAAVQAASREFEDRLAAVHATLDEVVSGITPTPQDQHVLEDQPPDHLAPPDERAPLGRPDVQVPPGRPDEQVPPGRPDLLGPPIMPVAPVREPDGDGLAAAGAVAAEVDVEAFAPGAGEPAEVESDQSVLSEHTQLIPAVRTALRHPTKEMPAVGDDPPWWRRGKEARDARDTGAA